MQDALLLAGVVSFALGILLGSLVSLPLPALFFLLLLSAGFFFAWFFGKRDWYLFPTLFLLFLALGAGRITLTTRTLPAAFVPLLDTPVTLTGVIAGDPDVRETNQRITIEIKEGNSTTKILAVADRYPEYCYGDEVSVKGTLSLPQPFDTDGGRMFAYDTFLAKDGVFAMLPHASLTKTGESNAFLVRGQRMLYDGKHAFTGALENALPEPEASLAEGLIAGGKQGLGKALLDAFTISGLLPIIVLSGYNVMIVANAILKGLKFLPKRFAALLAILAIALFVLAAGGGSSALRAALMAALALFARASGRTYAALRSLVFVFVVMLLLNPLELVYDPGFQFSFAATLGLILISTPLQLRFVKIKWSWLREVVATTIAAQLFVLPLLLYQTGNLSLVAVPANILVLPIVPFAMAFSAFAGFVSLLVPALGIFAGLPAYVLLAYIVEFAQFVARIPLAQVIVPAFPALLLVLPYAAITWITMRLIKTAPAKIAGAVPLRKNP